MAMITYDGYRTRSLYSTTGSLSRFIAPFARYWREYRLLRDLDKVPGTVMKDVGYPAAGDKHEG